MTPQTSTTQMILHEHDVAVGEGPRRAAVGGAVKRSLPALRLVEGRHDDSRAQLRRESRRRRMLGTADVLASMGSLLFVLLMTGSNNPGIATLAAAPFVVVLFKISGLYDRDQMRLVHSTLDEAPALVQLSGLFALTVTILSSAFSAGSLTGGQLAALWVLTFITTFGGRIFARWLAGKVSPVERCLVIGDPELADRIREKIGSSHARAVVVATLPFRSDEMNGVTSPASLRRLMTELAAERVIIAPTTSDSRATAELIRVAKAGGVRVSVLPRMFEVVGSSVEFDDVDGLTMLGIRPFGLSRSSRALKRLFDLAASTVGLLAVAPILAVLALAVRLDSRGPILFRQVRVGRDGRHFHIYKFRSMVADAERQKEGLRALSEVGDEMFKLKSDPRITRVGAFLRRTSLDEMPQLLNVLRGEMSLVGPRPLVTDEDAQVHGLDRSRLHLTPGMTGPWQVLGARVPMQEMVAIDYLYVASWSLWADVKLLLRTVRHVFRAGNV